MKGVGKGWNRSLMSLSYQERKKAAVTRYRQERNRMKAMEPDELDLEYMDTKAAYESQKNGLSIFSLFLVITALSGLWKSFFSLAERLLQYLNPELTEEKEAAEIVLFCSLFLLLLLTAIITAMLLKKRNHIKRLSIRLQMLEDIRTEHQA